jgi:hypothetical protein
MSRPNDTAEIRAKVERRGRVVVQEFFRAMDQHRLAPDEALMAATNFLLALMQALERNGDVARTREECAQRAEDWFSYVRACVARGEEPGLGVTGLPH